MGIAERNIETRPVLRVIEGGRGMTNSVRALVEKLDTAVESRANNSVHQETALVAEL
jgi:hypothetical protein